MTTNQLYEKDFAQWLYSQKTALKNKNWDAVDVEHLIENLEMGDPKSTLESDLLILVAHLFKLSVQSDAPDWMNKSWYNSIDEHRSRIQFALEKSGSLRRHLPDAVNRIYPKARRLAIKEGKRADGRKIIKRKESDYPTQLPDGWFDSLLDEDWYPVNS
ncbi:MAG: DUF29 domain-containing protein [Microcystaceae cyanobacterium]